MAWTRYVRLLSGAGLVSAVLAAAAPDPAALHAGLAAPERWVQRDGLDVVLAQLVGSVAWLLALWLAVGFALVAGSRLPGAAGRASATLARGALPAGVRRTAAVALGASLATSALPAVCLPSAAAGGRGAPSAAASTSRDEAWPTGLDRLPARSDLDPTSRSLASARPIDAVVSVEAVDWPVEMPDAIRAADTARPAEAVDWPTTTAAPDSTPVADAQRTPDTDLSADAVDWPESAAGSAALAEGRPDTALPADAIDWPETAAASDPAVPAEGQPDTVLPAAAVDWPRSAANFAALAEGRSPADAVDWPRSPVAADGPARAGANRTAGTALPVEAVERRTAGTAGAVSSRAVDWPLGRAEAPRPTSVAPYSVIARAAEPVIVAPGDTLWSIASRRLGPGAPAPAVAVEWRRWHAANRTLIGPDPRRLRPGTALRPPAIG